MTRRAIVLAWVGACVMATLILIGLVHIEQRSSSLDSLPEAPIVVIGSSLMRHAFPEQGPAKAPIGEDQPYVRFAVSSLDEHEALDLLDRVLKEPTKVILVEINPIAFDFAFEERQRREGRFFSPAWVLNGLREFSDRARLGLRAVVDTLSGAATVTQQVTAPPRPDRPFYIDQDLLARLYPLFLRPPREAGRLRLQIARAREKGIEIVLLAPPRSTAAANYIGEDVTLQIRKHLAAVAEGLGLPLFQPAVAWPDNLFVDQAHLNRAGARRFQEELAAWWGQRS
jgi:hypothetical protein